MSDSKRFAVQILFYDCDQFILKTIENCAPFVEKIYIMYSPEPWNAYNKQARNNYKNTSNPEILKQSKYYSKIQLITGVWATEEDQRNECLEMARKEGFDYMIVQDADEFYNPSEYQKNLEQILHNPDHYFYRCPWYLFWKSTKYVIMNFYPLFFGNEKYAPSYKLTEINFNPCFAVNCKKDIKFKDRRMLTRKEFFMLDGICFHLSYVLSDKQVESKLRTWGHSHQVNIESWLKTKWYGWTPETKNINPLGGISWRKAKLYTGPIPAELEGFDPGEQKYVTPSKNDLQQAQKAERMTYMSFIMKDVKFVLKRMLKR